jgi:hypothetical protein
MVLETASQVPANERKQSFPQMSNQALKQRVMEMARKNRKPYPNEVIDYNSHLCASGGCRGLHSCTQPSVVLRMKESVSTKGNVTIQIIGLCEEHMDDPDYEDWKHISHATAMVLIIMLV